MIRILVAALVLAACGSKPTPKPPPKPRPIDPAALAAQIHDDLVQLASIAHTHKASCAQLVTTLRAHVQTMRTHKDEVDRASADAELAVKLRAEVETYAEKSRGIADAIGTDLGEAWKACDAQRKELQQLIDQIPTM